MKTEKVQGDQNYIQENRMNQFRVAGFFPRKPSK